jgi:multidrug resistance protein, MATE family
VEGRAGAAAPGVVRGAGTPAILPPPMPENRSPWLREELAALGRLAAPLAAAQAGQALMGVVDTAVVGRAGAVPLAGVGLGNGLFFTAAVIGIGLMMGLDPLIAQAFGAGDAARARRLLWQGGWLALLASAALALPMALLPLGFAPLGVEAEVAEQAGRFILWRLPGLPFLFLYVGLRAYLAAAGVTRPMVAATVLANLVNLPLGILLVFGGEVLPAWAGPLRALPALGATGAALGSSFALVLQSAVLLAAIRGLPAPTASPADRRPDRRELLRAATIGLPVGLHMVVEVAFFSMAGFLAARLGAVAMASHQLALSVATLTFTVAVGIGNAGSVRVGRFVGARDRLGARRAGLAAMGAAAGYMACTGLAFLVAPGLVARLMTDDAAVAAAAVPLLRIAAVFQVFDGTQAAGSGVLRGAGLTRFTFLANVVGHWLLGAPALLLFTGVLGMGVPGLWWGFVVGLVAVSAAVLWRFLQVSSREISPLAESM